MQRRKPLTNRQVIDLIDRRCSFFLTGVGSGEVCEKLLEVDAVVAKGVRADVALITKVFEELLDELLHKKSGSRSSRPERFDLIVAVRLLLRPAAGPVSYHSSDGPGLGA